MLCRRLSRRNPLKIRASLGHHIFPQRLCGGCRNPLKIRASLGQKQEGTAAGPSPSQSLKDQGKSRTVTLSTSAPNRSRNPLKIRASLGPTHSVTTADVSMCRNPLKIRASLGLWTAWHSHVDSRFHCANIRHKREEKVAGPKLIHIKSLLAF